MDMKIAGIVKDVRTNTTVIYAIVSIPMYLKLVGADFESFLIQRRREKHKAYERMKRDLIEGALLPPITLAVKPQFVNEIIALAEAGHKPALEEKLAQPGQVNILDGLQRTYILTDLQKGETQFKDGQSILVEFWLEADIEHLIYRIIVLNAGQKPMSIRHQIELLFMTLKTKIEEKVPELQLFTEKDTGRRTKSRKYALDRIATAYQAYITKSADVERENVVAQMLVEGDVFDANEADLFSQFNEFMTYLVTYAILDDEICRIYVAANEEKNIPTGLNWFGSENVINSFFAAIAQLKSTNPKYGERITEALVKLTAQLQQAENNSDPMGLETLHKITGGFTPRKYNVGFATRRLLTNGFKEFFRESGDLDFASCWLTVVE
ncbi:MAG: hypothetical protein ABSA18_05460 [Dehalococcoidia bacterium]|jgi:hypothetical protein